MRSFAMVALVVFVAGCRKESAGHEGPPPTDVVAKVGDQVVLRSEVEAEINRQPEFVRGRYSAPERRRELVDSIVRSRLLVAEAKRRGIDHDPEIAQIVEKAMIQRLLTKQLADTKPDEATLKAFFDQHHEEFSKPERVRVTEVLFGAPKGTDGRAKAKAEAQRELTAIRALKPDAQTAGFAALARRRSDHDGARAQDGDLGPRTIDELKQQLGETESKAAFALSTVGQMSEVVESDRGFTLFRLTARQPAEERTFDQVRPIITARLTAEARSKGLETFVESLKKQTTIEVNDAEVAKISVAAPTGPLVPPPTQKP